MRERGKVNAVEEWRWVRCRTGVTLRVLCISIQQHMACQRTARLVMVIPLPAHPPAVHGCPPSPPHDVVVKKEEGEGGSHVPQERSAHKCVHHTHWMQSGDSAHTHTHTCSWRASLLPHHSTKKGCSDRHGESVWWWWCGPLAGMHGVVAMVSCTAAQHGFHLCHAKRRE